MKRVLCALRSHVLAAGKGVAEGIRVSDYQFSLIPALGKQPAEATLSPMSFAASITSAIICKANVVVQNIHQSWLEHSGQQCN